MQQPTLESEHWEDVRRGLEALLSVANLSRNVINRYRSMPLPGSQASKELAGFPKGNLLKEAYSKGGLSLVVACDHADALVRALSKPVLSFSPWTCMRGVLESCSMCIWMLDTAITPVERTTRSLNVRLEEIRHAQTYARKQGARDSATSQSDASRIRDVTARVTYLRGEAQELGINEKLDKNDRFLGFGDGPKSISSRVESTFEEAIDYSLLSPAAHGDSWALLSLGTKSESGNPRNRTTDISRDHALLLISMSLEHVARSTWTLCHLFGWDLAELRATFEVEYDRVGLKASTRFWH